MARRRSALDDQFLGDAVRFVLPLQIRRANPFHRLEESLPLLRWDDLDRPAAH